MVHCPGFPRVSTLLAGRWVLGILHLMVRKKVNGLCTPSRSEETVTMSATGEQYVVDEHGNRVAIILPLREYEQLQEDLHDLAVVAERREEPSIGFDEFKKRYER